MKRAFAQLLLPVVVLVALAACGGAGKRGAGGLPGGKESGATPVFPVTRKIPGQVTFFAATARLDHAAQLVRDLLAPLGRVEDDAAPPRVDQFLRAQLGFSPISPADLADAGLAVERNFAVFSTGLLPTFVLPVADPARLNERLARLTQGVKMVVSEHRGLNLTAIREGEFFLAWTMIDDWLLVHIGAEPVEPSTTAWLNEILDSKASLAQQQDLEWAWQQKAAGQEQALGLARMPALFTAARALDRPDTRTPACDQMNAAIAQVFGRVAVSAALAEGKADARGFVELAPAASTGLTAHVAAPPEAAYLGLREQAGFALSAGVDLDWLGKLVKPYQSWDCGIAPALLKETDLDELEDPLTAELGKRAVTSYHVALLGGKAGFSGVDLKAVGFFGVTDEAAVKNLLGQLGQGEVTKVNGVEVVRVSIVGAAQPLEYVLGGGTLRVAMGAGLVAKLLAGGQPAARPSGAELVSLAVRPDLLPDLLGALQLLGGRELDAVARFLGEFKWLRAASSAENGGLRLTGGFELR